MRPNNKRKSLREILILCDDGYLLFKPQTQQISACLQPNRPRLGGDWCDQGFKALADLPAAQNITFGDSSYAVKSTHGSTVTAIERVLQSKIAVSNTAKAAVAGNRALAQGSPQFSFNSAGSRAPLKQSPAVTRLTYNLQQSLPTHPPFSTDFHARRQHPRGPCSSCRTHR